MTTLNNLRSPLGLRDATDIQARKDQIKQQVQQELQLVNAQELINVSLSHHSIVFCSKPNER